MVSLVLLSALHLGFAQPEGDEKAVPPRAQFTVRLPHGAALYIDDVRCPVKADKATFIAPELPAGVKYSYTLRVEVPEGDRKISRSQRVWFQAGETIKLDLREPDRSTATGPIKTLPTTKPPDHGLAIVNKQGNIEVEFAVFKAVPYTLTRKRVVEGKEQHYQVTAYKWVSEMVKSLLDPQELQAFDSTGSKLDSSRLRQLLRKKTPVFLAHGDKVDPFYLRMMKEGSLILLMPGEEGPPFVPGEEIAPPKKGPRIEPKIEPKVQPNIELRPEPKVEYNVEPEESAESPRPAGPPPQQLLVRMDKEGRLVLRHKVTEYVPETRVKTFTDKDGQPQKVEYTVNVPRQVEKESVHDPKKVKIFSAAGKRIAPNSLADRLAKETPVLVTFDGRMVDPFYLQVINEGTLILVLPPPPAPKYPPGV